jgi:hypothetical protein
MQRSGHERGNEQGLGEGQCVAERVEGIAVEQERGPGREIPEYREEYPAEQAGIAVRREEASEVRDERPRVDRRQPKEREIDAGVL